MIGCLSYAPLSTGLPGKDETCGRLRVIPKLLWALLVVSTMLTNNPSSGWSAGVDQTTKKPSAEYLEALHTANKFLWAWTNRDAELGLRLVSARLRAQIKDESWLRQFMVGLSNPHHQAFEIGEGRKVEGDKYLFPVTLYELYDGDRSGLRYKSKLVVVGQGQSWRVDTLPVTSDNQ